MHILFVTSAKTGGALTELVEQVKALKDSHSITVVRMLKDSVPIEFTKEIFLDLPFPKKLPQQVIALKKLPQKLSPIIERENPDIIVSAADVLSYWVGKAAKLHNKPFVPLFQMLCKRKTKLLAKILVRYLLENSDAFCFVSRRLLIDFQNYYKLKLPKAFVLYSPIDCEQFAGSLVDNENREYIAYFGRLAKIKCPELFVYAASIISEKFPKQKFLIIGDGPERARLERLLEKFGLADKTTITGWVSSPIDYLRRVKILVHTAPYEGFGRVVAEAICSGAAVVSCGRGGVEEILGNNAGGILVEPSPKKMAETTLSILNDARLMSSLVESGRRKILENFSKERFANDFNKMVDQIVGDKL